MNRRPDATRFELGSTPLIATAVGGVESCYQLPGFDLNLDIGRCPVGAERQSRLLLTHGHIDHAAGLPYYVSLRGLYGYPPPTVYVPAGSLDALANVLKAWTQLQTDSERCRLMPLEPGQTVNLGRGLSARAFAVDHRIDALGYTLIQTRKKLRAEFQDLTGPEIRDRVALGETVQHEVEHAELSYPGDTTIRVFERSPHILQSRILILECTFVGPAFSAETATRRGHVHLDQLAAWAEHMKCERLFLTHFSQRYDRRFVEAEIQKLPESLRSRVEIIW